MTQTQLQFDDEGYPDGFWHWLRHNEHVYKAFKVKALSMALTGREHYSARCICEVIRWETEIQDSEVEWKLNNNYIPGMARLWMREYGDRFSKFFRLRDSLGRDE